MNVYAEIAESLAEMHAQVFDTPWSASAFAELLGQPGVFLVTTSDGFILGRAVVDEAEVLTLAVVPSARRRGLGSRLVKGAVESAIELGATRMFLEVADDNAPGRALYGALGFEAAGCRPRYYQHAEGPPVDALILVLNLS